MDHSQPFDDVEVQENPAEESLPDFSQPLKAEQETPGQKRDLKERYFLTRKELRENQRLLALREEELRKLRFSQRRDVEQSHEQENLRASADRLHSRVDELQRQLTDSRNQLRQARTEAAEKSALAPILEKETSELREQLEVNEGSLTELSQLLEQREQELQKKNGSLYDVEGIQDRLDQREKDLLEREEDLHETREQLIVVQGTVETTRQTTETLTAERNEARSQLNALQAEMETARRSAEELTEERAELAARLKQVEASLGKTDETISMLQEKLMESGEELIKQEESVRDYRYLMETLKREKADQEASYAQAVGELETSLEASTKECGDLRDQLRVHQKEQEKAIGDKEEMAIRMEQAAEAHLNALADLEGSQVRALEQRQAEASQELTGVLQGHAQEIDKLKMGHASELGEMRDSVNRLQTDLEAVQLRGERLQSELDDLRPEVPRLNTMLTERDRAISETRALLQDAMSRLESLEQPPDLDHCHQQPLEHDAGEMWPIG